MKPVAIYRIINDVNEQSYIGISKHPAERFKQHVRETRRKLTTHFHRALRKYGPENFRIQILGWAETPVVAKLTEIELIRVLRPAYNSTGGGDGVIGYKPTPECRARQVAGQIGKKRSHEARQNISKSQKGRGLGRKLSQETCLKMSVAHTGKTKSEETKARMTRAQLLVQATKRGELELWF